MFKQIIAISVLWFTFLSLVAVTMPEAVGAWQAKVEFGFVVEADAIGLWEE